MITGGCHCGACRFAIAGDIIDDVAHCHCTICRRSSGAAVMTWGTVPRAAVDWLGSEPVVYASSAEAERLHCGRCGAQLAFRHARFPTTIDIAIGVLDAPERFPARRHIWTTTRLPWLHLDQQLPDCEQE